MLIVLSASRGNNIGIPYILMSKAPGCALSEYDWCDGKYPIPEPETQVTSLQVLPMSEAAREKVMRQLGAISGKLLETRLEKVGSIFEDDEGNYQVGECLSPSLIWQWRDSLEGIDRGPFSRDSEYLGSLISAFTPHAQELPLSPNVFFAPMPSQSEYPTFSSYRTAANRWNDFVAIGQKIENSKNRLAYCIAGQLLHRMIPRLSVETDRGFPIIHPDLHPGNVFVDEDFNITCIIDWSSASSAPIAELLSTPGLGGATIPPPEQHVAAFRMGVQKGLQNIAQDYWGKADMMWSFQ